MRRVTALAAVVIAAACGGGPTDGEATPTTSASTSSGSTPDDAPSNGAGEVAPAAAESDGTFDAAFLLANVGNFPSLDDPRLIPARDASWIEPDDIILGVVGADGEAQAYPINQMAYHHIANTELAGEPFLVTY